MRERAETLRNDRPHRHPRRHVRSDSSRPPRSRNCGRARALARSRPAAAVAHTSASQHRAARIGVSPVRDGRAGGGRARHVGVRSRSAARRAVVYGADARGASSRRLSRPRSCSSSPAATRSPRSPRGTTTLASCSSRISSSSRARARRRVSDLIPNPQSLIPDRADSLSVEADTPDVSSTDIRRRVGAGESIDGLVPSSVAGHIRRHHLYVPAPVAAVL